MKNLLLVALILFANISFGQSETTITTIDFVKTKNNKRQETFFYYKNNWKVFRDIALEKGYIKSYKLLTTSADTTANFDLILVTEYADSSQFKLNEERFQQIIKEIRPDGSKLLNELKPNDFRQNVFFKKTETLFSADKTKTKQKTKAKIKLPPTRVSPIVGLDVGVPMHWEQHIATQLWFGRKELF